MPKPTPKESKNHFIKRCIPQLMNEGKPQDQAVAVCYSMWENRTKCLGCDSTVDIEVTKKDTEFICPHCESVIKADGSVVKANVDGIFCVKIKK